jgi:hypothetical protein
VDWGVAFGLAGIVVGTTSLVYARTQAVNARRQADAAHLAATLETQRIMADRIYQSRMDMARNPAVMAMLVAGVPGLAEIYGPETRETALVIRNQIDNLQDMYFLRKRGIVEDRHWANWGAGFAPLARAGFVRTIFENAAARKALDPEFVAYMRPIFDGAELPDPKDMKR